MRGNWTALLSTAMRRVMVVLALLALMTSQVSTGDEPENQDPREEAALKLYWEALQACQLARDGNPRLRCYQAAREVYLQALDELSEPTGPYQPALRPLTRFLPHP